VRAAATEEQLCARPEAVAPETDAGADQGTEDAAAMETEQAASDGEKSERPEEKEDEAMLMEERSGIATARPPRTAHQGGWPGSISRRPHSVRQSCGMAVRCNSGSLLSPAIA